MKAPVLLILILLILILLVSGCTQKRPVTTVTTSIVTTTVPTTSIQMTTTIGECVVSLCDCKCHPKGTTIEETTGKLCGIDCKGTQNVTGCELVDNECQEVYVKVTKIALPVVRELNLTVSKEGFEPDTIVVNKGDTVKINTISADSTMGFAIKELYISEKVYPHRYNTIIFVANTSGNITYYCPRPCGKDQRSIRGTLVVN